MGIKLIEVKKLKNILFLFLFFFFQSNFLFSNYEILYKDNKIDSILFEESLKFADAKMWEKAFEKTENISNPSAKTLITWLKLRSGIGKFQEYSSFIKKFNNWPGLELLSQVGEKKISSAISDEEIISYFNFFKPKTGFGALRLAIALEKKGFVYNSEKLLLSSWVKHKYSDNDFKYIQKNYSHLLRNLNQKRIENLLWSGDIVSSKQMLPLFENEYKSLIKTRISIKNKSKGLSKKINELPKKYQNDPGLSFDRFIFRNESFLHDSAQQLLIEKSKTYDDLGRPIEWAKKRAFYSRLAIKNGDFKKAYEISSNHRVKDIHYKDHFMYIAELEWLSGFISFNFFKKYDLALFHFKNFSFLVKNPISRSKAAYWIGRTYEKMNKLEDAKTFYKIGSRFQTSFYGQLAAERGLIETDKSIFKNIKIEINENNYLFSDERIKLATLLFFSKRSVLASRFFSHVSEELDLYKKFQLAKYTENLNFSGATLSIAKQAVLLDEILPSFNFPMIDDVNILPIQNRPLVIAIIRCESEFFSSAISSVGAKGLMQIMPKTGKEIASRNKLKFDEKKLLNDKKFNIRIGNFYLEYLLKKFNGSKVLAIAAYNAGPKRVERWISENGDPREKGIDPLNWIELIPYYETRNYIMRVLESEWVYDGKINDYVPELDRAQKNFGHKF